MNLTRRYMVHICKDGTITYRDTVKKEKVFNGVALPVGSTDTKKEAEALQIRFGRLAYEEHPLMPGKPWFKLSTVHGEPLFRPLNVEDLEAVGKMFEEFILECQAKKQETALEKSITSLLVELKKQIDDDHRCSDDPEDKTPGMQVTIGVKDLSGDYGWQTGDNSYTGGAYGRPHWAIIYLYRKSNSKELAAAAVDELAELVSQEVTA